MMPPLLEIRNLAVEFRHRHGRVVGVEDVDLEVSPGEVVGLVGESGSGKTVTALAVLGLLPAAARVAHGDIRFRGVDLLALRSSKLRALRGGQIGMVFQDPLTSLHPSFPVGAQIAEVIRTHRPGLGRSEVRGEVIGLLQRVGIPDAERRARSYPHQWSGGMRQRAMVAMAVANRPVLVIADEPTTALDVTIQAQILDLLRGLTREIGTALLLITHDLGVVAELCDRVVVLYAGRVAEAGPVGAVFATPEHHYTAGLLASVPRIDRPVGPSTTIPGHPAAPGLHAGCPFARRCPVGSASAECQGTRPLLRAFGGAGRLVACHHPVGEA